VILRGCWCQWSDVVTVDAAARSNKREGFRLSDDVWGGLVEVGDSPYEMGLEDQQHRVMPKIETLLPGALSQSVSTCCAIG